LSLPPRRYLVPTGAAIADDFSDVVRRARALGAEPVRRLEHVAASRADYFAPYNSTAGAPSGPGDGVQLGAGRAWAEVRSATHSGGSGGFRVTLLGTENGVRALVEAPDGTTVSAGTVRWWAFDAGMEVWHLGPVEEDLPTGAQRVATTDQIVTVGAR